MTVLPVGRQLMCFRYALSFKNAYGHYRPCKQDERSLVDPLAAQVCSIARSYTKRIAAYYATSTAQYSTQNRTESNHEHWSEQLQMHLNP